MRSACVPLASVPEPSCLTKAFGLLRIASRHVINNTNRDQFSCFFALPLELRFEIYLQVFGGNSPNGWYPLLFVSKRVKQEVEVLLKHATLIINIDQDIFEQALHRTWILSHNGTIVSQLKRMRRLWERLRAFNRVQLVVAISRRETCPLNQFHRIPIGTDALMPADHAEFRHGERMATFKHILESMTNNNSKLMQNLNQYAGVAVKLQLRFVDKPATSPNAWSRSFTMCKHQLGDLVEQRKSGLIEGQLLWEILIAESQRRGLDVNC